MTSRAHPRMRGDHVRLHLGADGLQGPPPHARGSLWQHDPYQPIGGPTPACAGITGACGGPRSSTGAHPRMRGDHNARWSSWSRITGPPPHARGSPAPAASSSTPARPTPACAGITADVRGRARAHQAHPRMRGDHARIAEIAPEGTGPPPHARGSPRQSGSPARRTRPTPACAGITNAWCSCRTRMTAHPRMRGDHFPLRHAGDHLCGPPPHARGSLRVIPRALPVIRPTPACAGITGGGTQSPAPTAAHPRMRGDHTGVRHPAYPARGPPPHARGSRVRLRRC